MRTVAERRHTGLRRMFLALLLPLSFTEWSCSPADAGNREAQALAWDTAFSIRDAPISRSSPAVRRSSPIMGTDFRMERFLEKCRKGQAVAVGFIGGSVTAGANATETGKRYSSLFCEFLRRGFPGVQVDEFNAAIGATDSRYACSRVTRDILLRQPDLLVIEFAVNDDWRDSLRVQATMEGLVRRTLSSMDGPVLLYHTLNLNPDTMNHCFQERIARHYGIGVVSALRALAPHLADATVESGDFLADGLHPNDLGHLMGAYLLYDHARRSMSFPLPVPPPIPALPEPLLSDLYQHAGLMETGDDALEIVENQGWSQELSSDGRYVFKASDSGAVLEIGGEVAEFTVGIRRLKDRRSRVAVSVDGEPRDTLASDFPEDWGGGYMALRQIFASNKAEGRRIRFVLLDNAQAELERFLYAGASPYPR